MTGAEFKVIAMTLRTFYTRENLLPNNQALELWFGMLKDLPYDLTHKVVEEWAASSKWSPTVAEIRNGVTEKMKASLADRVKDYGEDYFRALYERRQNLLPETQEDIIREYMQNNIEAK